MAKKKQKKKEESSCLCGLILLGILIAIGLVVAYALGCFDSSPKFQAGDCLVNRNYDLVEIKYAYKSLQEYHLVYLKPSFTKEFLVRDEDKAIDNYDQSFDYVEKYYDKVKCTKFLDD